MAKILVVDDSSTIRELIIEVLEDEGYEVEGSGDGQKALELAEAETFDLVITDYNMPNLNGIQMSRSLRKLPQYEKTSIVMLTIESDDPNLRAKGEDCGVKLWLVKPFDPDELLAALPKLLPKAG